MQKSYFYNYFKQLGKQDQKRFLNVLDLYPKDIKPRFYSNVQNQIENNTKIANSTKEKMLNFNNYILWRNVFIKRISQRMSRF